MFSRQKHRNQQLVYGIVGIRPGLSMAILRHLVFLVDLRARKELGRQISSFRYKDMAGPFSFDIYKTIEQLIKGQYLKVDGRFYTNHSYAVFTVINEEKFEGEEKYLKVDEIDLLDNILDELKACNAKQLTEISLQTRPFRRLRKSPKDFSSFGGRLDMGLYDK